MAARILTRQMGGNVDLRAPALGRFSPDPARFPSESNFKYLIYNVIFSQTRFRSRRRRCSGETLKKTREMWACLGLVFFAARRHSRFFANLSDLAPQSSWTRRAHRDRSDIRLVRSVFESSALLQRRDQSEGASCAADHLRNEVQIFSRGRRC